MKGNLAIGDYSSEVLMSFIELEWHSDHTLSLWLNRPDKFNALSTTMTNQLRVELNALAKRSDIKLLIIRAHGKHFCAGADINEMADAVEYS